MGINIRQKGATGEREVVKMLNGIIRDVMVTLNFDEDKIIAATDSVQRNQNQTAVGGNDLTNTFGLSIEVKRQEQLALGTWWAQTCAAANRNNELPVLLYRQNRKPWKVRTFAWLNLPDDKGGWTTHQAVVDFDVEQFKNWFTEWVRNRLQAGWEIRT